MQNFTTTLKDDLLKKNRVYLPAKNAKFTLIDVKDVGEVGAIVLLNSEKHRGKSYDLTNQERLTFGEMAGILTEVLGRKIRFISPNLFSFYFTKRKEGVAPAFILVMILLHFLPRFQKAPPLTQTVKEITGKDPVTFRQFVTENKALLRT